MGGGVGASAAVNWQPATIHALKGFIFWSNANQSFGVGTSNGTQAIRLLFPQPGFSYTLDDTISLSMFSETI